jgi:hypothetical protein
MKDYMGHLTYTAEATTPEGELTRRPIRSSRSLCSTGLRF